MPRILVVDDDPMIAMLLADWLSELGHEPLGPAYNSASALSLIETSRPDAAIVDVSLGAGSGYTVAECLAKREIPFVFATGHVSLDSRFVETCVLVKPFEFAAVQTIVGEMTRGCKVI
jgi:CheY-like chemotaxis protein